MAAGRPGEARLPNPKRCNLGDAPFIGNPVFSPFAFSLRQGPLLIPGNTTPRRMTIYIARNGDKLGPFSLAEAQKLLRTGSIQAADLAWYEGLATWIPVSQVPGLSVAPGAMPLPAAGLPSVPPPRAERPVLVWIICIFYFISLPFSLLSMALMPLLKTFLRSLPLPESQQEYFQNLGLWNYYLPAIVGITLLMTWAVQFFRLKRNSFYFLIVAMVFGFAFGAYNVTMVSSAFASNANAGSNILTTFSMWFGVAFGFILRLALLYYNWYLLRKRVLR